MDVWATLRSFLPLTFENNLIFLLTFKCRLQSSTTCSHEFRDLLPKKTHNLLTLVCAAFRFTAPYRLNAQMAAHMFCTETVRKLHYPHRFRHSKHAVKNQMHIFFVL